MKYNKQVKFYKNNTVKEQYYATEDGKKNGEYTYYYENGQLMIKCNYKNNMLDGLYEEWYKDGQPKEKTIYKKYARETSMRWYENGNLYYKADFNIGEIIYWYLNGRTLSHYHVIQDKFGDTHYNGLYEEYYDNGNIYKMCNYDAEGKIIGEFSLWHPNGKLWMRYTLVNNNVDGLDTEYYDNGNIMRQSNFKNGLLDGPLTDYYKNGNIREECNYKDDKLNGENIEYDENGYIIKKMHFTDGIKDKKSDYHEQYVEWQFGPNGYCSGPTPINNSKENKIKKEISFKNINSHIMLIIVKNKK